MRFEPLNASKFQLFLEPTVRPHIYSPDCNSSPRLLAELCQGLEAVDAQLPLVGFELLLDLLEGGFHFFYIRLQLCRVLLVL